jgi:hypothetical protein
MSEAVVSAPVSVPAPRSSRPFLLRLYNHNPFYVISALLMLFAVRNAYGTQEIGSINCWLMLGVLCGYTALLSFIGVLIVRCGKVWEDARSIFVVVLLLFLATSVSADDLFVKMESRTGGLLLLLGCYFFSALTTEGVFRGVGIRLGWLYRLPYHLLIALFFFAPWWTSPELHPRSPMAMEWLIVAFPVASAALVLMLLPAVRRGSAYLANNGTPWPWPLFPWIGFGVLIVAHALRSFAMCMTFGPRGPIWLPSSSGSGREFINFDTMWGPYFLIPLAFAVLVLILEGTLTSGNTRLQRRVMISAPLLLLMALPFSTGPVFRDFFERLTSVIASPLWIALGLVWLLYGRAWLANVRYAGSGLMSATLLYSVVGLATTGPATATPLQPWPWLLVGAALLISGFKRSSLRQAAGAAMFVIGLRTLLPETDLAGFRNAVSLHVLWAAIVVIGFTTRDHATRLMQCLGAVLFPLAALAVSASPSADTLPASWKLTYVAILAGVALGIAVLFRSRVYRYAVIAIGVATAFEMATLAYRGSASLFGRAAMTSFLWSLALLLIGLLISAHKARWIPPDLLSVFGRRPEPASELPQDAPPDDATPNEPA